MGAGRFGGLRAAIALEAARLMYEESVKQYFTAKRLAAKRLLGRVGGRRLRYCPSDLPSNGEIRDALLGIAELAEGSRRRRRLFAMRIVALQAMRALEPFSPRLIGSVSTGHIRRGSDIDLHVFTDDTDDLVAFVRGLGWSFETEPVSIFKFGEIREYLHLHVVAAFPLELTVYATRERRFRPRSSTDGQPIVRLKSAAVAGLCAAEHPEEWARYERDGTIAGLEEWLAHGDDDDAREGGPYDGLLDDEPPDPAGLVAAPGELPDDDEDYDPLPGFESV